jgi:hypothetical protein
VRTSGLRFVEFVLWVGSTSAVTVGVLAVVALIFGEGLLTLKYLLFVVGFIYFGVGTIGMRASLKRRPDEMDLERRRYLASNEEWDLEARLQDVPPLRRNHLPFDDRVSRNVKLFATGVTVLAISFVMEAVLGVQVGTA